MTLAEKQSALASDLLLIEEPQERLGAIVDRARRRPPLSEQERIESNRVRGCVSQTWLVAGIADGRCVFRGDADSPLVRGLVTLLCDLYSGAFPMEVAATEPELIETLGLDRMLSPTRLNGLRSVRTRIREFALAHG